MGDGGAFCGCISLFFPADPFVWECGTSVTPSKTNDGRAARFRTTDCYFLRPCYCYRMKRSVDVILGLTAAVATALLLTLIGRDEVGMSADMIRTDALSAAGIIFVAIAGGSMLRQKK